MSEMDGCWQRTDVQVHVLRAWLARLVLVWPLYGRCLLVVLILNPWWSKCVAAQRGRCPSVHKPAAAAGLF